MFLYGFTVHYKLMILLTRK